MSETNAFLANQYICQLERQIQQFCQELTLKLILDNEESNPISSPPVMHEIALFLPYSSHWNGRAFEMNSCNTYNQFTCNPVGCNKRVCSYCVCNPSWWLCHSHWRDYFVEQVMLGKCDGGALLWVYLADFLCDQDCGSRLTPSCMSLQPLLLWSH